MVCVLFYSKYCKYCKKFINISRKSGISQYITNVCVDRNNNGKRDKAVKEYKITEVPTILIEGKKIVGYNAFEWLNEQINSLEEQQPKKPSQKIDNNNNNNNKKDEKMQYFSLEKSFKGDLDCDFVQINNDDNFYQTIDTDVDDEKAEQLRHNSNFKIPSAKISSLSESFGDQIRETAYQPIEYSSEDNVNNNILKPIMSSKDKLKSKQVENTYNKLLKERDNI